MKNLFDINHDIGSGYQLISLLDSEDAEAASFIQNSPELTIYHREEYIRFSQKYNGIADLYVIKRGGQSLVAFPLHRISFNKYTSGYSGILFPNSDNEKILRSSIQAFIAFLRKNPKLDFDFYQSLQAVGGLSRKRAACLGSILSKDLDLNGGTFSRVLNLDRIRDLCATKGDGFNNLLLDCYDSKIRNQIRTGLKKKPVVTSTVIESNSSTNIEEKIRCLYPLLSECRNETGMGLKSSREWVDEVGAIVNSGGKAIIVELCLENQPCCAIITYVSMVSAIYWMGFSNTKGKRISAAAICLHYSIQQAEKLGVNHYEIGRTDHKQNRLNKKEIQIYNFKSQFRGEVYPVLRIHSMGVINNWERVLLFITRVNNKLRRLLSG
jgi:hypothetical protein